MTMMMMMMMMMSPVGWAGHLVGSSASHAHMLYAAPSHSPCPYSGWVGRASRRARHWRPSRRRWTRSPRSVTR
jgi:hypothetical protein